MISSTTITIGGLNFLIRSARPLVFQPLEHSRYSSFISSVPVSGGLNVNVSVNSGDAPGLDGMTRLFDSGEAWAMYARDSLRRIVLQPGKLKTPMWSAEFEIGGTDVTVFCNEELSLLKDSGALINPVAYPLDLLLVMYILAQRQGVIVHAAGVDLNGKGLVFPARSGTGKSTLMRFFGGGAASYLSDDRIVVRKSGGFLAYGTPWLGDAGIGEARSVPLAGIFFLKQAPKSCICAIKPAQAMEKILPVVSVPWYDKDMVTPILEFCEKLVASVPVFELQFTKDPAVVELLKDFAAGKF